MKNLNILHLGPGAIGSRTMEIILKQKNYFETHYGVSPVYQGLFSSKGGLFDQNGLDLSSLQMVKEGTTTPEEALEKVSLPFAVIDTTASESTVPLLLDALKKGGYVISSNKKPFSSDYSTFQKLYGSHPESTFFETTVGAGLPVIQTVQTLLATGDEVVEIQGCFSGTLGYLCSELQNGSSYADAVTQAREKGFTEPDPRDDLSGMDVARKALILARLVGQERDMNDISVTPLFNPSLSDLSVEEFMSRLPEQNKEYHQKFTTALQNEETYRYVATINQSSCHVGLQKVPLRSPLGSLLGPDNIVILKTKRYYENPLVVQGPGAGVDVTAAGVVGDLVNVIKKF